MRFLINRDKSHVFKIGFLNEKENQKSMDSIVLVYKKRTYTKSSAVLKSMYLLGGLYKLSIALFLIPRLIRDYIYTQIARNRYKWFGKQEQCLNLPKEWQSRIIKQKKD